MKPFVKSEVINDVVEKIVEYVTIIDASVDFSAVLLHRTLEEIPFNLQETFISSFFSILFQSDGFSIDFFISEAFKNLEFINSFFFLLKKAFLNLCSTDWLNSVPVELFKLYLKLGVHFDIKERSFERDMFTENENFFLDLISDILSRCSRIEVHDAATSWLLDYFSAFTINDQTLDTHDPDHSVLERNILEIYNNLGSRVSDHTRTIESIFVDKKYFIASLISNFKQHTFKYKGVFPFIENDIFEKAPLKFYEVQTKSTILTTELCKTNTEQVYNYGDSCTYHLTKSKFTYQPWFKCLTCSPDSDKGCCLFCARVCHNDHKVIFSKYSNFFCDCGASDKDLLTNIQFCKENISKIPKVKLHGYQRSQVVDFELYENIVLHANYINNLSLALKSNQHFLSEQASKDEKEMFLFDGDERHIQFLRFYNMNLGLTSYNGGGSGDEGYFSQELVQMLTNEPSQLFFSRLQEYSQLPEFETTNLSVSFQGLSRSSIRNLLLGETSLSLLVPIPLKISYNNAKKVLLGIKITLSDLNEGITAFVLPLYNRKVTIPYEHKDISVTILLTPLEVIDSLVTGTVELRALCNGTQTTFSATKIELYFCGRNSYTLVNLLTPVFILEDQIFSSDNEARTKFSQTSTAINLFYNSLRLVQRLYQSSVMLISDKPIEVRTFKQQLLNLREYIIQEMEKLTELKGIVFNFDLNYKVHCCLALADKFEINLEEVYFDSTKILLCNYLLASQRKLSNVGNSQSFEYMHLGSGARDIPSPVTTIFSNADLTWIVKLDGAPYSLKLASIRHWVKCLFSKLTSLDPMSHPDSDFTDAKLRISGYLEMFFSMSSTEDVQLALLFIAQAFNSRYFWPTEGSANFDSTLYLEDEKRRQRVQYRCDQCAAVPVFGFRYNCENCNDFDLCLSCYPKSKTEHPETHTFSLHFIPVKESVLSWKEETLTAQKTMKEILKLVLIVLERRISDETCSFTPSFYCFAEMLFFGKLVLFDLEKEFLSKLKFLTWVGSLFKDSRLPQFRETLLLKVIQKVLPELIAFGKNTEDVASNSLNIVSTDLCHLMESLMNGIILLNETNNQQKEQAESRNSLAFELSLRTETKFLPFIKPFWSFFYSSDYRKLFLNKSSLTITAKGLLKNFVQVLKDVLGLCVSISSSSVLSSSLGKDRIETIKNTLIELISKYCEDDLFCTYAKSCLVSLGINEESIENECRFFKFKRSFNALIQLTSNDNDASKLNSLELYLKLQGLNIEISKDPELFSSFSLSSNSCFELLLNILEKYISSASSHTNQVYILKQCLRTFFLIIDNGKALDLKIYFEKNKLVFKTLINNIFSLFLNNTTQIRQYSTCIMISILNQKVIDVKIFMKILLAKINVEVIEPRYLIEICCLFVSMKSDLVLNENILQRLFLRLEKSVKFISLIENKATASSLGLRRPRISFRNGRLLKHMTSLPCLDCWSDTKERYETFKLDSLKVEKKFTSKTMIYALSETYEAKQIQVIVQLFLPKRGLSLGGSSLERTTATASNIRNLGVTKNLTGIEFFRSINSTSNIQHSQHLSWVSIGKVNLDNIFVAKESKLKDKDKDRKRILKLSLPVDIKLLKISFLFKDTGSGSESRERESNEPDNELFCPRCETRDVNNHGICNQCGEVAFQCRICRNINYEDTTSFLCIECGHCKYAKFSFSFVGCVSFNSPKIESVNQMNASIDELKRLITLRETYSRQYENMRTCNEFQNNRTSENNTSLDVVKDESVEVLGLTEDEIDLNFNILDKVRKDLGKSLLVKVNSPDKKQAKPKRSLLPGATLSSNTTAGFADNWSSLFNSIGRDSLSSFLDNRTSLSESLRSLQRRRHRIFNSMSRNINSSTTPSAPSDTIYAAGNTKISELKKNFKSIKELSHKIRKLKQALVNFNPNLPFAIGLEMESAAKCAVCESYVAYFILKVFETTLTKPNINFFNKTKQMPTLFSLKKVLLTNPWLLYPSNRQNPEDIAKENIFAHDLLGSVSVGCVLLSKLFSQVQDSTIKDQTNKDNGGSEGEKFFKLVENTIRKGVQFSFISNELEHLTAIAQSISLFLKRNKSSKVKGSHNAQVPQLKFLYKLSIFIVQELKQYIIKTKYFNNSLLTCMNSYIMIIKQILMQDDEYILLSDVIDSIFHGLFGIQIEVPQLKTSYSSSAETVLRTSAKTKSQTKRKRTDLKQRKKNQHVKQVSESTILDILLFNKILIYSVISLFDNCRKYICKGHTANYFYIRTALQQNLECLYLKELFKTETNERLSPEDIDTTRMNCLLLCYFSLEISSISYEFLNKLVELIESLVGKAVKLNFEQENISKALLYSLLVFFYFYKNSIILQCALEPNISFRSLVKKYEVSSPKPNPAADNSKRRRSARRSISTSNIKPKSKQMMMSLTPSEMKANLRQRLFQSCLSLSTSLVGNDLRISEISKALLDLIFSSLEYNFSNQEMKHPEHEKTQMINNVLNFYVSPASSTLMSNSIAKRLSKLKSEKNSSLLGKDNDVLKYENILYLLKLITLYKDKGEEQINNFEIFMQRAANQDLYFRGALKNNPLHISAIEPKDTVTNTLSSSGSITNIRNSGNANRPKVNDLIRTVALELGLESACEVMEILVCNKILSRDLYLEDVYKNLWIKNLGRDNNMGQNGSQIDSDFYDDDDFEDDDDVDVDVDDADADDDQDYIEDERERDDDTSAIALAREDNSLRELPYKQREDYVRENSSPQSQSQSQTNSHKVNHNTFIYNLLKTKELGYMLRYLDPLCSVGIPKEVIQKEETVSVDEVRPMIATYRLRGIDGEATEEYIDETALNAQLKDLNNTKDNNKETQNEYKEKYSKELLETLLLCQEQVNSGLKSEDIVLFTVSKNITIVILNVFTQIGQEINSSVLKQLLCPSIESKSKREKNTSAIQGLRYVELFLNTTEILLSRDKEEYNLTDSLSRVLQSFAFYIDTQYIETKTKAFINKQKKLSEVALKLYFNIFNADNTLSKQTQRLAKVLILLIVKQESSWKQMSQFLVKVVNSAFLSATASQVPLSQQAKDKDRGEEADLGVSVPNIIEYRRDQLEMLFYSLNGLESNKLTKLLFEENITHTCILKVRDILKTVLETLRNKRKNKKSTADKNKRKLLQLLPNQTPSSAENIENRGLKHCETNVELNMKNIDLLMKFISVTIQKESEKQESSEKRSEKILESSGNGRDIEKDIVDFLISSKTLKYLFEAEKLPTTLSQVVYLEYDAHADQYKSLHLNEVCHILLKDLQQKNIKIKRCINNWTKKRREKALRLAKKRRATVLNSLQSSSSSQVKKKTKKGGSKTSGWMKDLKNLEEEDTNFKCLICFEGYGFRPNKMMGVYVHSKPITSAEDYFSCFSMIFGENCIENKDTQTIFNSYSQVSSVSAFNIVHFCCHEEAALVDKSNTSVKARKSEWKGAQIRNGHVGCNNLLPLRGFGTSNITDEEYSRGIAIYLNNLFKQILTLGDDLNVTDFNKILIDKKVCKATKSFFTLFLFDIKSLLLRFSYEEQLTLDSKGGGKEDNFKLLVPLLQVSSYFFKSLLIEDKNILDNGKSTVTQLKSSISLNEIKKNVINLIEDEENSFCEYFDCLPLLLTITLFLFSKQELKKHYESLLTKIKWYAECSARQTSLQGYIPGSGAIRQRSRKRDRTASQVSTFSNYGQVEEDETNNNQEGSGNKTSHEEDTENEKKCLKAGYIYFGLILKLKSFTTEKKDTHKALSDWAKAEDAAVSDSLKLYEFYTQELLTKETNVEFLPLLKSLL